MSRNMKFWNRLVLTFFLGGPVALSAVISILIPDDILKWSAAQQWVEFVLRIAPKMFDVPIESRNPQVVKFYHATMLSGLVVWALLFVWFSINELKNEYLGGLLPERYKFKIIYEVILCVLGFAMSWAFLGFGYGYGKGAFFWYSRESLLFLGYMPYVMLSMALGVGFLRLVEFFLFSNGIPWFKRDVLK